jgi:hypothetical protein
MSSGVFPSCNCRSRWPKEAFTGLGRADKSSLLLPIQMMTLPDNRGSVGELAASVARLSGGGDFFNIISQIW